MYLVRSWKLNLEHQRLSQESWRLNLEPRYSTKTLEDTGTKLLFSYCSCYVTILLRQNLLRYKLATLQTCYVTNLLRGQTCYGSKLLRTKLLLNITVTNLLRSSLLLNLNVTNLLRPNLLLRKSVTKLLLNTNVTKLVML